MADMMATLGLGLDASQLETGLPNIKRLLDDVATAATAAKAAQASYNTAAKVAAPSSNGGDIARQFRALQQLNAAKALEAQADQALAVGQADRLRSARELMPLYVASAALKQENVKAIYDEINATSAEIAIFNNATMAKKDAAAAAAAAATATQALGAAQAAATPATQAATTATQALTQQQSAATISAAAYTKAHGQALEMDKQRTKALEAVGKQAVTLTDVLSKLGLAYTAGQVGRAAAEVLTLAARYQTLGVVLDVVGRNVGKSRQEMRALSEGLQEQGISAIASREELARMAAANLDLSKAVKVAEVAQNAAVIAGVNSSAAFERVITAITTQQPRVLRTIGIYVNFEAAQEKYAKAHGRRMEQLTGQERAQINLDVALKGGAQVVGAYAAAMNTAGKQLTSTVRYMQDMKTQLGETFLPQFTAAVKLYGDTLKYIGDNANIIAPIIGGVLVTALLLAGATAVVLAGTLAALSLPIEVILVAVAAGATAMDYFASTADDARKSTAELNKRLDEDSEVLTAYTKKIEKMSTALLEAEKRQKALQGAADFELLSGLGAEVLSARKAVDAKPDYRATMAERSETKSANIAALAAAEKVYADALRMSNIGEQERARLLQESEKRATEATGATDDGAAAAEKAAKKTVDYQKALREANDALYISAAVMAAGTAPTLAQQRALEDLNAETALAAKILDIQAKARGEDAEYTKAEAAQLVLLTQRTGENAAATLVRTRAYEDWLTAIDEASARWEKEREQAEKRAEIQAEETKRINEAIDARDKAVQSIEAQIDAKRSEIAVMQASTAGQKRELEYLAIRNAKFKEYLDATRVGAVADPRAAEALTNAFMDTLRLQDALKDEAASYGEALKDVVGIAKGIARAFGDVGRQVSSVISVAMKLAEVMKKVETASSLAKAANAAAAANPSPAATQAATAAGSAASAAKVAGGLSIALAVAPMLAEFTKAFDLFGTRAKARAKELQDAARAFNLSLELFGRGLKDATLSDADQRLAKVGDDIGALVNKFRGLLGIEMPEGFRASEESIRNWISGLTAQAEKLRAEADDASGSAGATLRARAGYFENFANELGKIADLAKEAEGAIRAQLAAEIAKLTQDLAVRNLRATGLDAEADAMAFALEQSREMAEATAQYGTATAGAAGQAYLAALAQTQLAEATAYAAAVAKKAAEEAERVRRSVFDTTNATRGFTDPRGAGLAALDENAARRYNDAATAAEKAAVALYNVAERADYLAQQLEADRRTTESLTARIMGTYDTRGAEDLTRGASQRQEMADAIRSGMSETNIALLRFAQFAENSAVLMARNIEDGTAAINEMAKGITDGIDRQIEAAQTIAKLEIAMLDGLIASTQAAAKATAKNFAQQIDDEKARTKAAVGAIDEQIKTAKSALQLAGEQAKSLETLVNTNAEIVTALQEFSDSLKLGEFSTLSPEAKLGEARTQFEALTLAAQGGDTEAAKKLPDAANALLDASRGFNASNEGFVADYDRVQSVMSAISAQYGADLPMQELQLIAAQATVERLNQTIESLGAQKDAIQEASSRQIDMLNKMKDKAADDAQKIIDGLNERKDKISKDADAIVTKLEAQKKAVEKSATDQIAQLVRNETQAHNDRLQTNAYFKTYLGYIGANDAPIVDQGGGGITDIGDPSVTRTPAKSVASSQLTETKALNGRVDTMITRLEQLVSVAVAASDDEVGATRDVSRGVNRLIEETRAAAQAAATRTQRVTTR